MNSYHTPKIQKVIWEQELGVNGYFKDFLYTKINQTQIQYGEFNLYT